MIAARPADDIVRTDEDQRIDDLCRPRLNQGVDHFANCVAAEGRKAEQQRQESQRLMDINDSVQEEAPVCKAQEAYRACQIASVEATRAMGTERPSETVLVRAMDSCRAACNPDSAQVLRNFLHGCQTDIGSTRQLMRSVMNNCGYSTMSETAINSATSGVPQDIKNLITSEMSFTDKINAGAQRLFGYSWSPTTGAISSPYINSEGTQLSGGVRYMQMSVGGVQTYGYCSVDNSCHQTYEAAAKASAPLLVRSGYVAPTNPTFSAFGGAGNLFGSSIDDITKTMEPPRNAETIDEATPQTGLRFSDDIQAGNNPEVQYSTGTEVDPQNPRPVANPRINGAGGDPGGSTSGTTNPDETDGTQQVVSRINNETPVNYNAANFAGLQSAMKSPISISAGSSGGSNEITNSGSNSGSGNLSGTPSAQNRPLPFTGSGQISPFSIRGADAQAARAPIVGQIGTLDVASSPQGNGGGGFSMPEYGSGRMVAAARPGGPSIEPSSFAMRSDSYYRTGSRGGAIARPSNARPNTCKGPNCRRNNKEPSIASANCDGNPQCLLALTGKLKVPRRSRSSGDWDSGSSFEDSASTGRGLASVRTRTIPGGVVRGKTQDVLNLLGSSGVFKIDHEGMLEVDM